MSVRILEVSKGRPAPLGVTCDADGANVAVFSEHATAIDLCLFSDDGSMEIQRLPLPEKLGPVWHGYVRGLKAGALYGLRARGPYRPEAGHRFNHHKLLLDPYARALSGRFRMDDTLHGYDVSDEALDLSFSNVDSAASVPKCVVMESPEPVPEDERPHIPWEDTIIYEAHPKGLTQLWPGLQEDLRGTWDALCTEPVIAHLKDLGVTAVELLPVHAFVDDRHLVEKGLANYWGYNSIGFFAPEPRYNGPGGYGGFRNAVRALHEAGLEVILDVVFNHTAEGDQRGPTISFRGLDNASYYRLQHGQARYYVNETGTGNTMNITHPFVLRLVMDSLRWWVEAMGVDGFRFDLASSLGREAHGFDPRSGFFDILQQDPVLSGVKLIAEPWDLGPGGYQLGGYPHYFGEWNDRFRDTVRRYWRGDPYVARELAEPLLGSAGLFDRGGRRTWSSINFVAAHDGFTLADVTAYEQKHNEANGEDNRDGHSENLSSNGGIEGETDDPDVLAIRARRQRNLLATLFLSQGTPMLLAGDEVGNSQKGNNNAYAQDNPIGWINWGTADRELCAFTTRLIALRHAHPCLRQSHFLHGQRRASDGRPDVEWLGFNGGPVNWRDPGLAGFCLMLRESAEAPQFVTDGDCLLLAFNGADSSVLTRIPTPPDDRHWVRVLDTARPDSRAEKCPARVPQRVIAQSIAVFALDTGP